MVNNGRNWLLRSLRRAAFSGPAGLEIFLAITSLLWGIMVLTRFPVLIHNGDTITKLTQFAPLWFWVGLFFLFGSMQLISVWTISYRWRVRAAFVNFMWWIFFLTLDVLPAGFSPTSIMFFVYAIAEAFAYLLLSVIFVPMGGKKGE